MNGITHIQGHIAFGLFSNSEGTSTQKSARTGGDVVAEDGDVRMEKVGRLRDAIASGRYDVTSADLADTLMRRMLGE